MPCPQQETESSNEPSGMHPANPKRKKKTPPQFQHSKTAYISTPLPRVGSVLSINLGAQDSEKNIPLSTSRIF